MLYSNEPCQLRSAYKQIWQTDDSNGGACLVLQANHLSLAILAAGNVSPLTLPLVQMCPSYSPVFSAFSGTQHILGRHGKSLVIIFSTVSCSLDCHLPALSRRSTNYELCLRLTHYSVLLRCVLLYLFHFFSNVSPFHSLSITV